MARHQIQDLTSRLEEALPEYSQRSTKKAKEVSRYLGYAIHVAFLKRCAYARRLPKSNRRQSSQWFADDMGKW